MYLIGQMFGSIFSCSIKGLWDAMMTNYNKAAVRGQPITASHCMPVSHIPWQIRRPLE